MNGREPFLSAAQTLLDESGCTVRVWRTSTTGGAWVEADDWGIEVPEPRGPVSYGTFAHEVGHQMLHRGSSAPRWLQEIEAWEFALDTFDRFDLPLGEKAEADAATSIGYSVAKALRRTRNPEALRARIVARLDGWPLALAALDPSPADPRTVALSAERRELDRRAS